MIRAEGFHRGQRSKAGRRQNCRGDGLCADTKKALDAALARLEPKKPQGWRAIKSEALSKRANGEIVSWLTTVPATDQNFILNLHRASATDCRAALECRDLTKTARTRIEGRLSRLVRQEQKGAAA